MPRFLIDANVLMNAAIVADSAARRLVDAIARTANSTLCVDEVTWQQVISVLQRKSDSLRLAYRPMDAVEISCT